MKRAFPRIVLWVACIMLAWTAPLRGAGDATPQPGTVVNGMIDRVFGLVEGDAAQKTFTARLRVVAAEGLPAELAGATARVAVQAPDRVRVEVAWRDRSGPQSFMLGRDRQEIWAYAPGKHFGVVGKPGVARFAADPKSIDTTVLGAMKLPMSATQVKAALLLANMEMAGQEEIGGAKCHIVGITIPESLREMLGVPDVRVEVAIRQKDQLPARVRVKDARANVEVLLEEAGEVGALADERWKIQPAGEDRIETVAVSHLSKCLDIIPSSLTRKIPTLGPARGQKELVATSGKGRLELHDGTRVLFLKGTPEEMGHQQGELVKKQARDLVDRVLYGVGVGSSFVKGRWFFGEIGEAQRRLAPFISDRTTREIDAMAAAAGVHPQEARLANFFPELFHCTGFAITGEATAGGRIYHGRVLDYLRGVGLEGNAVVAVYQPDEGHAWVNCGYAGFVGSVTAMNEKGISMGEMGGRGEGKWDGKPMAQLIREVMEKAGTLEEAIEIVKKGPRTCQYFYVIADGKSKQAVGIAATPEKFEMVRLGQKHELLPHAIKDCVLLSAGQRYEALVERVKAGYGKFDAESARGLMDRPVCMTSNIQSVLFAPDTLDFWVANADSRNVASQTRYTRYNLAELLKAAPAARPKGILNGIKGLLTN